MSKKVLIAEDSDDIRKLLRILLEKEGFEVHEAPDGEEALRVARRVHPDLVVLDVMMPHQSGYEVCEALKSDPNTSGIYVLFLSSRTGLTAEAAMRSCGGDATMAKPFKPLELTEKVKGLLETPVAPTRRPLQTLKMI